MKIKSFDGAYPERKIPRPNWLDQAGSRLAGPFLRWRQVRRLSRGAFVKAVDSLGQRAAKLNGREIRDAAGELGLLMRRHSFTDPLVARCFSLIREVAGRTLAQRHFSSQLIGGRALLDGMIAEMETGEGKTLTATLAAATAALAGIPVHVITVNDYLASRDAEGMSPLYESLGLTVGAVVHGLDPAARRKAYRADITYCTNKEVAFDYLKDRIVLGREAGRIQLQAERLHDEQPRLDRLLLRGLCYAIVDEADDVLIDEARTPLIISGGNGHNSSEREVYETALSLAAGMELGRDFIIEGRGRATTILPAGLERLERVTETLGGVWSRRQWREELARQALDARHLYLNEKQYLIKDDKIQIIDEYTGRTMPDRSWENGLHQMIEVKEGCEMTDRIDPLAKISFQRFFSRYLWLAGMTGTAREVTGEIWSVYRLATARIPTNRPRQRQHWPDRIYGTQADKWRAIVDRIDEIHRLGRPVLVGTRSVDASEHLSRLLTERGLDHQLLNAKQDSEEATIVSGAGGKGRITVATNMAGRGTDIKLGPGVADLGGLHVIATELHDARRVDRQLFGRCGRQGDPGSCEVMVSLEDELAQNHSHPVWTALNPLLARSGPSVSSRARALNLRMAQRAAERLHFRMRRDVLKMDERLDSLLAFSGRSE